MMKSKIFAVLMVLIATVVVAETPEEVLARSDKNIDTPIVKVVRSDVNGGILTTIAKVYFKGEKSVSKAMFPPKYVGNTFVRVGNQGLFYLGRSDRLIRTPQYIYSIALMGSVMYLEDNSKLDYLGGYKATSMSTERKNGYDAYVLEIEDKDNKANSYFYKRKVWIDKKSYFPIYQELYDKGGKFLKIIEVVDLDSRGKYYFAKKSVHKHPTDPKLHMLYTTEAIKFDAEISDSLFSKMSLN